MKLLSFVQLTSTQNLDKSKWLVGLQDRCRNTTFSTCISLSWTHLTNLIYRVVSRCFFKPRIGFLFQLRFYIVFVCCTVHETIEINNGRTIMMTMIYQCRQIRPVLLYVHVTRAVLCHGINLAKFVCLSVCLSIYRSIYLSACMSVCLSACLFVFVCLLVFLSVCLYVCLSVCMFACLSVCLPVCLSVSLYVCLSVCWSICRSVCLPVCPSLIDLYDYEITTCLKWIWIN